jgi:hypothetical protein
LLPFFMVSFNVLQIDFHIERTWDKKSTSVSSVWDLNSWQISNRKPCGPIHVHARDN